MPIRVECAPAFDYARASHTTEIIHDESKIDCAGEQKALFTSKNLKLDLRYISESSLDCVKAHPVELKLLDLENKGHKGKGVYVELEMRTGQAVTFVLRTPSDEDFPKEARPTADRAEELGVPLESMLILSYLPSFEAG